jgi:peptidyl-prolyl cis-trans isomerase SurA
LLLTPSQNPARAQTDPGVVDPGLADPGMAEPAEAPPGTTPQQAPEAPMPPEVAVPSQNEQRIVLLVNDDPISAYDIEQRERLLIVTQHEQPGDALKKKAIDQLIDERLQMQQGKKDSVTAEEENISQIVGQMAQKNNLTPEGLANALGQMGINIKTLKDHLRAEFVWRDVVRRKFRHEVDIGEADVDKALAGNGNRDGVPQGTALQLRQVKFEISNKADQKAVAEVLAAAEALRARVESCNQVAELVKSVKGATVNSLEGQQPNAIAQPARLLVMNAKVGQMTPPTFVGSSVELYAVCGKQAMRGDPKQRQEVENKLMEQELGIRAERLLRDIRQDAFIEYR